MYSQFLNQIDRDLKICLIFNEMWLLSDAGKLVDLQKAITLHCENGDDRLTSSHLGVRYRHQRFKTRREEVLSQLSASTPWFSKLILMTRTLVDCVDCFQFHQSSIRRQISIQLSVMVAKSIDRSLEGSAQKFQEKDYSVQTKRAV